MWFLIIIILILILWFFYTGGPRPPRIPVEKRKHYSKVKMPVFT